ncbi:hypothetical protein GQX73_g2355 [Xylaria multiplex]|uniref:Uncharacterized protein n=1 Tax=Xylaria multiplex TaxID=323545 RepID=A0A7C8NBA0_9PEZI|nr:hypothetical protein GQX73_g2355 [Xylaria multiplex]
MPKRSSYPPSHIAYMEDADDDGHVLSGTEPTYAKSVAPGSPRKQQPNTSKARRDSRRTAEVSSSTDSSDSTAHPMTGKGKSKVKSKDERRSSAVVVSKQRPPARSAKTAPGHTSRASDDSSAYYTIPHHPSTSRPRARTRPESYYGQTPPTTDAATKTTYVWGSFLPTATSGDLAMRFRRPSSSMGFRQVSNPYEYEASPERSVARRPSVSRKASKEVKEREDRKRMPPPPRPKSTRPERIERLERPERPERQERQERQERPERIVLKPQPQPQPSMSNRRKSVVFDDDDLDIDSTLYHDNIRNDLRRGSGVEYGSMPFKNRRQSFDAASESVFNYEDDEDEEDEEPYYYEEEPPRPRSRSRRRSSHMGIEDKMRDASRYQDNIGGGPTSALTAEALRKVKTGGSSRSTRSSASRDESEYKHSATTHTTRSSSGEDDITIKVSAGCVVEVGNVKIHSTEGGEVSVGRTGTSRMGSDRGTSIYGDERRIRSGGSRGRASSQAAYARGLPAPSSYTPSPLYSQYGYEDDDSY